MRAKISLLVLGDTITFYASLFLALLFRYGGDFYRQFLNAHFIPFSIIFALWLIVFYVAGLYDLRHLRNNVDFLKLIFSAIFVSSVLSVIAFYAAPIFGITPKTNFLFFVSIFTILEVFWRRFFNNLVVSGEAPNRALLITQNSANPISEILLKNPAWLKQLGYDIISQISQNEFAGSPESLRRLIQEKRVNFIAVPRGLRRNSGIAKILYEFLGKGIEISDSSAFYETITRKVPLEEIEEGWFLENFTNLKKFYDPLKRAGEFLAALIGLIVLLPLLALIALLIRLSSKGPVIYQQIRVGQGGREFILYKFRTMRMHNNHSWPNENDNRVTGIGKILRKTHLDELPQLWNIIKGDISVVGPRPDFVDFYKKLEREIPYYSIRTIIKPGLTGWAQIHMPITASLEETKERLGYDFYYIKNRSLVLDLAIILKTFKVLFAAKGL